MTNGGGQGNALLPPNGGGQGCRGGRRSGIAQRSMTRRWRRPVPTTSPKGKITVHVAAPQNRRHCHLPQQPCRTGQMQKLRPGHQTSALFRSAPKQPIITYPFQNSFTSILRGVDPPPWHPHGGIRNASAGNNEDWPIVVVYLLAPQSLSSTSLSSSLSLAAAVSFHGFQCCSANSRGIHHHPLCHPCVHRCVERVNIHVVVVERAHHCRCGKQRGGGAAAAASAVRGVGGMEAELCPLHALRESRH